MVFLTILYEFYARVLYILVEYIAKLIMYHTIIAAKSTAVHSKNAHYRNPN